MDRLPGVDWDEVPRVEAMGEHPPITHEQFIGFCDDLYDAGHLDVASQLIEAVEAGDGLPTLEQLEAVRENIG